MAVHPPIGILSLIRNLLIPKNMTPQKGKKKKCQIIHINRKNVGLFRSSPLNPADNISTLYVLLAEKETMHLATHDSTK